MIPIIRSADCTSRDAKDFLEKFIEINHVDKNLENTETCHAPKKKGSISEFKKALEVHETALKDWKYSVQVTLDMFKESMEKSIEITTEINLIQAAVIKQDIEQVKVIVSTALEKSQSDLDCLLKEEMKCIIPEEWKDWELSSNCLWFLEA